MTEIDNPGFMQELYDSLGTKLVILFHLELVGKKVNSRHSGEHFAQAHVYFTRVEIREKIFNEFQCVWSFPPLWSIYFAAFGDIKINAKDNSWVSYILPFFPKITKIPYELLQ